MPFIKQTFTDKSDIVRVGVCKAFGMIGDTSAIPILEQALQDSSNFVRIEAAESLVKLGEKTGSPGRGFYVLNSALKIGDKWERRCAAKALARVGIPASIKILRMSLTEKDKKCRIYIAEAIIKISKNIDIKGVNP